MACAGPLLISELEALEKALDAPKRPLVAIVGGSKVSTKLTVLENLLGKVDRLIVGGGIANTFLAAAGHPIGKSLHEADMVGVARELLERSRSSQVEIPLPSDVVVAKEFAASAEADVKGRRRGRRQRHDPRHRPGHCRPLRRHAQGRGHRSSGTGRWACSNSTSSAKARGCSLWRSPRSPAFSIAGGGDTIAAIEKYGVGEDISYISTAGGAFLEFLEGKKLPAVDVLEQRAAA